MSTTFFRNDGKEVVSNEHDRLDCRPKQAKIVDTSVQDEKCTNISTEKYVFVKTEDTAAAANSIQQKPIVLEGTICSVVSLNDQIPLHLRVKDDSNSRNQTNQIIEPIDNEVVSGGERKSNDGSCGSKIENENDAAIVLYDNHIGTASNYSSNHFVAPTDCTNLNVSPGKQDETTGRKANNFHFKIKDIRLFRTLNDQTAYCVCCGKCFRHNEIIKGYIDGELVPDHNS